MILFNTKQILRKLTFKLKIKSLEKGAQITHFPPIYQTLNNVAEVTKFGTKECFHIKTYSLTTKVTKIMFVTDKTIPR